MKIIMGLKVNFKSGGRSMYTIGEVQALFGINASTIRYYEKEGILLAIARNDIGRRIYSKEQIEWLKLVIAMKETGMSLKDIKSYIDLIVVGDDTLLERREFLVDHKQKVEEHLKQIHQNLEKIIQKITYYDLKVLNKDYFQ